MENNKRKQDLAKVSPSKKSKCRFGAVNKNIVNVKKKLKTLETDEWELSHISKEAAFTCLCQKVHIEPAIVLVSKNVLKVTISLECLKIGSSYQASLGFICNLVTSILRIIKNNAFLDDQTEIYKYMINRGVILKRDVPEMTDLEGNRLIKESYCRWKLIKAFYSSAEECREQVLSKMKMESAAVGIGHDNVVLAEYVVATRPESGAIQKYGSMYLSISNKALNSPLSDAQKKAWEHFKRISSTVNTQSLDYLLWKHLYSDRILKYDKTVKEEYLKRVEPEFDGECYLFYVPNDVLRYILGYLGLYDFLNFRLTSKKFKQITNYSNITDVCAYEYILNSRNYLNLCNDAMGNFSYANTSEKKLSPLCNKLTKLPNLKTIDLTRIGVDLFIQGGVLLSAYLYRYAETLKLALNKVAYTWTISDDNISYVEVPSALKHLYLTLTKPRSGSPPRYLSDMLNCCPLLQIETLYIKLDDMPLYMADVYEADKSIQESMTKLKDLSLIMITLPNSAFTKDGYELKNNLISLESFNWMRVHNPAIFISTLPKPEKLKHLKIHCMVGYDTLKAISTCINLETLHITVYRHENEINRIITLENICGYLKFFPKLVDLLINTNSDPDKTTKLITETLISSLRDCKHLKHLGVNEARFCYKTLCQLDFLELESLCIKYQSLTIPDFPKLKNLFIETEFELEESINQLFCNLRNISTLENLYVRHKQCFPSPDIFMSAEKNHFLNIKHIAWDSSRQLTDAIKLLPEVLTFFNKKYNRDIKFKRWTNPFSYSY